MCCFRFLPHVILDIFHLLSMSAQTSFGRSSTTTLRDNVQQMATNPRQFEANAQAIIRRWPDILTAQEIKRLKEHKYASEGITLFDPYMQKFWKWLVEFCPMWIAPNLITLVGLAINIVTSVLLMILTNGAKEQVEKKIFCFEKRILRLFSVLDGCIFSLDLAFSYINRWMLLMVNKLVEPIVQHL